jgi:hypothetical protein
MGKIWNRTIGGLAGLGLAVAATVATAGPATAYPTGCGPGWAGIGGTYVTATCSGGTGTFTVWAQCQSSVWPYAYHWAESGRTKPGNTAWAFCFADVIRWGISRYN